MIVEAIVKKGGVFIKGYKPRQSSGKIMLKVEQVPITEGKSCRGILHKYSDKTLIGKEKEAWRSNVRDE